MKRALVPLFALLFAWAASALAQQAPPPAPPADDPIARNLFPPDLVMRHGADIGLDDTQRDAIKEAVRQAQAKFLDVQWDMQAESEKMGRLLQGRPIDEAAVLAQADKVLGLEREVKRTQLSLLIRIKNLLSPPQQSRLLGLRAKSD